MNDKTKNNLLLQTIGDLDDDEFLLDVNDEHTIMLGGATSAYQHKKMDSIGSFPDGALTSYSSSSSGKAQLLSSCSLSSSSSSTSNSSKSRCNNKNNKNKNNKSSSKTKKSLPNNNHNKTTSATKKPKSRTKQQLGGQSRHERPKRPLSGYNLFFQILRDRLVEGDDSLDFTLDDLQNLRLNSGSGKKRLHRRTHGKIGFQELAYTIGAKWKTLAPTTKELFARRASIDRERYNREMKVWKEQQHQEQQQQQAQERNDAATTSPTTSPTIDQEELGPAKVAKGDNQSLFSALSKICGFPEQEIDDEEFDPNSSSLESLLIPDPIHVEHQHDTTKSTAAPSSSLLRARPPQGQCSPRMDSVMDPPLFNILPPSNSTPKLASGLTALPPQQPYPTALITNVPPLLVFPPNSSSSNNVRPTTNHADAVGKIWHPAFAGVTNGHNQYHHHLFHHHPPPHQPSFAILAAPTATAVQPEQHIRSNVPLYSSTLHPSSKMLQI